MIRIYSDKTQRFYDSVEEATKAEVEAKEAENREKILAERKAAEAKAAKAKEAADRKAKADEIEALRKAMVAAQQKYRDALTEFCKKYGTYHTSISSADGIPTLFDMFDVPNLLSLL